MTAMEQGGMEEYIEEGDFQPESHLAGNEFHPVKSQITKACRHIFDIQVARESFEQTEQLGMKIDEEEVVSGEYTRHRLGDTFYCSPKTKGVSPSLIIVTVDEYGQTYKKEEFSDGRFQSMFDVKTDEQCGILVFSHAGPTYYATPKCLVDLSHEGDANSDIIKVTPVVANKYLELLEIQDSKSVYQSMSRYILFERSTGSILYNDYPQSDQLQLMTRQVKHFDTPPVPRKTFVGGDLPVIYPYTSDEVSVTVSVQESLVTYLGEGYQITGIHPLGGTKYVLEVQDNQNTSLILGNGADLSDQELFLQYQHKGNVRYKVITSGQDSGGEEFLLVGQVSTYDLQSNILRVAQGGECYLLYERKKYSVDAAVLNQLNNITIQEKSGSLIITGQGAGTETGLQAYKLQEVAERQDTNPENPAGSTSLEALQHKLDSSSIEITREKILSNIQFGLKSVKQHIFDKIKYVKGLTRSLPPRQKRGLEFPQSFGEQQYADKGTISVEVAEKKRVFATRLGLNSEGTSLALLDEIQKKDFVWTPLFLCRIYFSFLVFTENLISYQKEQGNTKRLIQVGDAYDSEDESSLINQYTAFQKLFQFIQTLPPFPQDDNDLSS